MSAYVYAIVVDGVVRYIGKGTGRRINKHRSTVDRLLAGERGIREQVVHRRIAAAVRSGSSWNVVVVAAELGHSDAFDRERQEIASCRPGQLWNLTDGGEGISSQDAIRRWTKPEYRRNQLAASRSPETIRRKSEASRRSQSNPSVRDKITAGQRAAFARPESKARLAARNKRFWSDQGYRAKVVAGRKAQWTPEARTKQSETHKRMWNDAARRVRSEAYKARFNDPEFKRRWLQKREATRAARQKAVA